MRTVAPLPKPPPDVAELEFDRVQIVNPRVLRVRVLAPVCCPLRPPVVQAVGDVIRLRITARVSLRQRRAPRWVEVPLPEPLTVRAVVPAQYELVGATPVRDARPGGLIARPILMPDRRTVAVPFLGGLPGCSAVSKVVFDSSSNAVRTEVLTGDPRGKTGEVTCARIGVPSVVLARLPAPLAGRQLVAENPLLIGP